MKPYVPPLSPEDRAARIADIVSKIEVEGLTLNQVGNIYNISRERIRQIYTKEKKTGVAPIRAAIKRAKKEEKEETHKKHLEDIKLYCIVCGNPSFYKDRSVKFCAKCKSIWQKENRDPTITFSCKSCGTIFHPFRNWRFLKTKPSYCRAKCFLTRKRNLSNTELPIE